MFILILFGALVGSATQGTITYEDCKSQEFKPQACWSSEQLFKAGKFLCESQGKPFNGSSDCK